MSKPACNIVLRLPATRPVLIWYLQDYVEPGVFAGRLLFLLLRTCSICTFSAGTVLVHSFKLLSRPVACITIATQQPILL